MNIKKIKLLHNATESVTAICADSYGKPYLSYLIRQLRLSIAEYFQCFSSLVGSCDKQNLTFVVIYETCCIISVICSPKAEGITKLVS